MIRHEKMERLQRSLIRKLDEYHDIYQSNTSALKLQIIQPIMQELGWDLSNPNIVLPDYPTKFGNLDYAFFIDGKIVSFLKISNSHPEKELEFVKNISKHLNINGGVLTDGNSWAFASKNSRYWIFDIDDEGDDEKFLAHIQYIAPQNIYELGESIELIIKTGIAKRLNYSWTEYSHQMNTQEILKQLYNGFFKKANYDNQDIDINEDDIRKYFETAFVYELKKNTPPTVIKVTLPDGKMIFDKEATQVLIRVVEHIGVEKVKEFANERVARVKDENNEPVDVHLIEENAFGKTQHQVRGENDKIYYLFTGTNNSKKMEQLRSFKDLRGLEGLKVEQLGI